MEQLRSGGARVVALMEPFISVAFKLGAHVVAATFYRGAEVVGANLSSGARVAYLDSINEAVDRINASPGADVHLLVEPTNGELRPEELSSHFLRCIHVTLYPRERLRATHSGMRSWRQQARNAGKAGLPAEVRCAMARELPRPFSMPWGSGSVVEEAAGTSEWHEPVIQLPYEDGSEAVRFCSYNSRGGFQRSPLIVAAEDLPALREALAASPRLFALLRLLTTDEGGTLNR